MSEGAWSRFLEYAAHARTKPTFEVEERQPKLAMAAKLKRVLEAARDGGDWPADLREALRPPTRHPFISPRYRLVPPRQRRWLREWTARDPDSLGKALGVFLEPGLDPVERFAAFFEAGERATIEAAEDDERARNLGMTATFALGSLFGFAVVPESLPITRSFFGRLEELLGLESSVRDSLVEQYAAQLDFAFDVRARMEAHPIPGLDMIDVQSLMLIGVREQTLWAHPAGSTAAGARTLSPGTPYLAACSLYLNEAPNLREWLEFHRLVGVERFFLYDNGSTDEHLELLAPYIESGIVTLHDWQPSPPDQREVYDDCLQRHRDDARWIAFLDIDEFLFSPAAANVSELLRDYERWPGVGVNWAMFSHSGHRARPEGLVIDRYRLRDRADTGLIKSIVDPQRTVRCDSAHWFTYDHGLPVDENRWPIAEPQTKSTSFERLRINHYASRSAEELQEKVARGSGWQHLRRWRMRDLRGELDLVRDDAIARWLPELEEALAKTGAIR